MVPEAPVLNMSAKSIDKRAKAALAALVSVVVEPTPPTASATAKTAAGVDRYLGQSIRDIAGSFLVRTLTGPIATHDKPVAEGEGPEGGGAGFDGSEGSQEPKEQKGKSQ